jgi:hypothetical protein
MFFPQGEDIKRVGAAAGRGAARQADEADSPRLVATALAVDVGSLSTVRFWR